MGNVSKLFLPLDPELWLGADVRVLGQAQFTRLDRLA